MLSCGGVAGRGPLDAQPLQARGKLIFFLFSMWPSVMDIINTLYMSASLNMYQNASHFEYDNNNIK